VKRITSQAQFDELRKHGIRKHTRSFDLVFCPCSLEDDFGLAIIISKKVANAVKRNKIKRWIRNFAHANNALFSNKINYLVISKNGIFEYGRDNIYKDLIKVLDSIE